MLALIRGGGDLSSGIALRLVRSGIQVVITELPRPLAVRRLVSFAQAVYDGGITVEGVRARLAKDEEDVQDLLQADLLPVLVDPSAAILHRMNFQVLIDARMTKRSPELDKNAAPLVVGLGPGFTAGKDCHAVIETKRGAYLGRVYWEGSSEPDSREPDAVGEHRDDRVLRAPVAGVLIAHAKIGEHVEKGQPIAEMEGHVISAPFPGMIRGLLMAGLQVPADEKIGDLDPRDDSRLCRLVSDKALSIGGAALEAILTRREMRRLLAVS
jgi:xanthine dehydrogenase accessory factor